MRIGISGVVWRYTTVLCGVFGVPVDTRSLSVLHIWHRYRSLYQVVAQLSSQVTKLSTVVGFCANLVGHR